MKKLILFYICFVIAITSSISCFAAETQAPQYPVKVNIFRVDLDFSKEKSPQTITFMADSDVANELYVSIVDTTFQIQDGKTIFIEADENSELEKYLKFDYNPTVDVVTGGKGMDVNIVVTPQDMPEGTFYKGIKVSYKTDTTISSVLIPVIIKNLVPGKHYSTGLDVTYIRIDGDYVISSPFQVIIGLENTGNKVLSSLTGELAIKNQFGRTVATYPITDKSSILVGAPKEIRVPVTAVLENGVYTAVAAIKYDPLKKDAVGSGEFEVKSDMSAAVESVKPVIVVKSELPTWVPILIIIFGLILIFLFLLLIRKKDDDKKNSKRENRK